MLDHKEVTAVLDVLSREGDWMRPMHIGIRALGVSRHVACRRVRTILLRLIREGIIETDGGGYYRIAERRRATGEVRT